MTRVIVKKKKTYVKKDDKAEKRYFVRKVKKGPEVRYINIEDYAPPKIKGCRSV